MAPQPAIKCGDLKIPTILSISIKILNSQNNYPRDMSRSINSKRMETLEATTKAKSTATSSLTSLTGSSSTTMQAISQALATSRASILMKLLAFVTKVDGSIKNLMEKAFKIITKAPTKDSTLRDKNMAMVDFFGVMEPHMKASSIKDYFMGKGNLAIHL